MSHRRTSFVGCGKYTSLLHNTPKGVATEAEEEERRSTAAQFQRLHCKEMQRLFLGSSPIHAVGLFTREFVPAGAMVIEYIGDVVRQKVRTRSFFAV
jgi:SET domain-containing protein